ncbi:MAG: zinc-dependent metalloprotease [Acidimicrobiia bacterium]|nr:zinc-dependent metalloprotease [Acidimicrobiia bacterium]
MDDEGIFEQLFKLLQSSGPVNWKLAREVTKSLAGPPTPIEPSVAEEYRELAHVADVRISAVANLPSPSVGELNPTDRATWAAENQQSFRILVEPLADKLSGMTDPGGIPGIGDVGGMGAMLAPLGPAILGLQAGTMVGFMSHRALGQFDTGIPAMDHDRPYVIVPNLDDFAIDHGVDHRQIRLWAALHEVAFHRIMAVEWVRGRFVSLVQSFYDTVEIDTGDLLGKLGAMSDPEEMQRMLGEGDADAAGLISATSDPERLADLQAFTAFIEGYGDRLVRIAGADLLPTIDRIEQAYNTRRTEPDQAEQFLQQFAGLSMERWRAGDAARFCDQVAERWGEDTLAKVWDEPENLPTLSEFDDPIGWAARVLLDEVQLSSGLDLDFDSVGMVGEESDTVEPEADDTEAGESAGHEPDRRTSDDGDDQDPETA